MYRSIHKRRSLNMRKPAVMVLTTLLILTLGSLAVSAKGFQLGEVEVGAGLAYGRFSTHDHYWDERLSVNLPVISVHGGYEALPGLRLLANYSLGIRSLDEPDYDGVDSYSYKNLDLAVALALTDRIDLVAGWTRFASVYISDSWMETVENVGGGFKVGAVARLPLAYGLSAEVGYSFIPLVNATTSMNAEEEVTYAGQGHELKAGLNYTTSFGLGVALGFRSEVYSGIDDCCVDGPYDLAGFRGGSLELSYSF
jgi:hypothetical protein